MIASLLDWAAFLTAVSVLIGSLVGGIVAIVTLLRTHRILEKQLLPLAVSTENAVNNRGITGQQTTMSQDVTALRDGMERRDAPGDGRD